MAIISRLRQLSGVRKMLRIEELIPSLNSDYKIERHRNSYGQGFGNYMYGHSYPISYGGSALREERDHLGEHLQSKIEKEFLIKSI